MTTDPTDPAHPAGGVLTLVDRAARHGLRIEPGSVRVTEIGLDYQVAFARTVEGADWVLRIPRRPDVSTTMDHEATVLRFVAPRLSVAVPDWQVQSPELIAYPLLPGRVGMTMDAPAAEPAWHLDLQSPRYARSVARLLAELHQVDVAAAVAAGVRSETATEVRARWQRTVDEVSSAFTVSAALLSGWSAWLADDDLWPEHCVLTHGELYPAHYLLEGEEISSVLDWTTAQVGDPAVDFVAHHMISSPETFDLTVSTYRELTGVSLPHLARRCAAITAASPLSHARYAMTTCVPDHLAAVAAQLDPPA